MNLKIDEWTEEIITQKYLEEATEKLKDTELKYKSLILCDKNFKEQMFKFLCSFLENLEFLEEFIFERNSCNTQMIDELIHSINIKINNSLKRLSLSGNIISEDQLKTLIQGFKPKSSLYELYLSKLK